MSPASTRLPLPILAVVASLLGGCATDEPLSHAVPPSPEALQCRAQCEAARDSCRQQEDSRASLMYRQCADSARVALERCEARASAEVEGCENKASARQEAAAQERARAEAKKKNKQEKEKKKKADKKKKDKKAKDAPAEGEKKPGRSFLDFFRGRDAAEEPYSCPRRPCVVGECYDTPSYSICDSELHACEQRCG